MVHTQSQAAEPGETAARGTETDPCYGSQPGQQPRAFTSAEDIDLALKVGGYLETLFDHSSATASQIAEALHGLDYTLVQVTEIYRICEELRQARIVVRGRDGYGYRF